MFNLQTRVSLTLALALASATHVAVGAPEQGPAAATAANRSNVAPLASSDAQEDVSLRSGGTVVTSNTAEVAKQIRRANDRNREAVLKTVRANIEATEAALANARRESRDMKSSVRTRFNVIYDEARARGSDLRQNLQAARRASSDDAPAAQSALAAAYENYAQAVAKVQAAVGGGAGSSSKSAR